VRKSYFAALLLLVCSVLTAQQTLNNDSIIKLVKAGLSDDLIISTVNASPSSYDTSANGLIALKSAGASDKVVAAIVTKTSAISQAPGQASGPAAGTVKLTEGSDVPLQFDQDLTSRTAADGDPVAFSLTEDLKVGDVVLAKAGSKAFGEVTNAKKAGMMGKAGELNVRVDYLTVGSAKLKLRGVKGKEGASGTTGAIVLTVLFGPIGLIKHGQNIDIKKGAPLKVYVAEDCFLTPLT
jgi:hypothetical protein